MKSGTKKISVFAVVAAIIALMLGATAPVLCERNTAVSADTENNIGRTYYYDELGNSELAQRFYSVFKDMADNGTFKNGTAEYDLSEVLTQDELTGYVELRESKIPVAFSSARDAFYMDNPDLFYVDVYSLYLTVGMVDGDYVAFIDPGKADNYYSDTAISSETAVNSAVALYENELKNIVNGAKAAGDVIKQIEYVNKYICDTVDYDYGKRDSGDSNGFVSTAYGALVEKKALCGGYSHAFKAVMDRLGIPCVLIQGYTVRESGVQGLEAGYFTHMWNAVQLDGLWYGVDTTYNSSGNLKKYLLVGDDFLSQDHIEDNVISSSGFELDYPALRPFDYGVNTDKSGFTFKDSGSMIVDGKNVDFGYNTSTSTDIVTGKPDRDVTTLTLGVSYNGKDANALEQDGLYLAYRYLYDSDELANSLWMSVSGMNKVIPQFFFGEGYTCTEHYEAMYKVQYAVIDYAPDIDAFGDSNSDNDNVAYNQNKLSSSHILAVSTVYTNNAYGTYFGAPFVKQMTPNEKGYIKSLDPVDISITYDEKLVYTEGKGNADVQVSVVGLRHEDIDKYVKIKNVKWDEETNTLSFRFTPSMQIIHNYETYCFAPTCLVGKDSKKEPEQGRLSFKREEVICPKVYNDGRLFMKVFGYPEFMGAEDMSLTDFKDEFGQPVAGNQRTQMMLVVNKPNQEESDQMMDELLADEKIGLEKSDIKSSATYMIDLQLCGMIQKIPDGSYMQIGFGFPEGYGPEDAGVTFTVYHYTRNPDGTVKSVEEVPCVLTEYGIIATVNSFSPFMICAVDSSKVTTKSIYASVSGVGGSINTTMVKTVADGESVSYTLKADSGYQLNSVMLNGESVLADVGENGVITIPYAKLTGYKIGNNNNPNSNILEVTFISTRAANSYAQRNITVVSPKIVVTEDDLLKAKPHEAAIVPPAAKNYTGLIVGIVVAVVVLACAGVAVYFILRNKKKPTKKVTAKTSATTRSSAAVAATRTPADKTAKPATSSTARPATTSTATRPTTTNTSATTRNAATTASIATRNTSTSASSKQSGARQTSTRPSSSVARPTTTSTAAKPTSARPSASTRPTASARPTSATSAKRPVSRNDVNKNKK